MIQTVSLDVGKGALKPVLRAGVLPQRHQPFHPYQFDLRPPEGVILWPQHHPRQRFLRLTCLDLQARQPQLSEAQFVGVSLLLGKRLGAIFRV